MMPGDIFYDSWGYDQTNIEFIQVIRLSPSGKTAYCRMMTHKVEGYTSFLSDKVLPGEPYGPEFKLRVRERDWLVGTHPLLGEGGKVFDLKFRRGGFTKWEGGSLHRSHDH